MEILILLISASLFIAIIFLIAFIWSTKTGQYKDTYSPSIRMLFDDETNNKNNS